MSTTWKLRTAVAAAVIGLATFAAPAWSGAGVSALIVNPTTVPAGGTFNVTGPQDCVTGTDTVQVPGLGLSQDVDASQPIDVDFTVPADATPGVYVVEALRECSIGDATITVTEAIPTTTAAPTTTTAAPAVAAETATAPAFTG